MGVHDGQSEDNGAGGGVRGILPSALKSKELLVPAALSAAGALAATKGPDLVHRLADAMQRKGEEGAGDLGEKAVEGAKEGLASGSGGLAGKMLSKMTPGGGEVGGNGDMKTRRLPIQRWTDVAVPVDKAYAAWIKFDDYPKFMHRVLDVRKEGDQVNWHEKIWFSKREWQGKIIDRRTNDRIAWKTTSGMSHRGIVSFHKLDANLTRVMVDMEFDPNGMIEKMASGLRFVKRAVQSDLARFKAYVEMEDANGIEPGEASRTENKREKGEEKSETGDSRDRERARAEREQARQERQAERAKRGPIAS